MHSTAEWQALKRAIVDRYATPSNLRGFLQLLSVFLPVAALWWALRAAAERSSPAFVMAATLCLSLFLLRGFVLMHDAGHLTLFRSRSLNRAAGFLLGVLSGLPQQVWAENHRYHHLTNGNWAKYRGPLNVIGVTEYLELSEPERRHYRLARNILMAPVAGCLYFLVNPRITWLRESHRLLQRRWRQFRRAESIESPADAPMPDCASLKHYRYMLWNNLVLLAAWGVMSWVIGPWLFLACYIASGSLAGAYGLILFTVQHNFEHSYASTDEGWDRDRAALEGTSFLVFPRWLNWITADSAYHHVHHLCASVPNYRLAACHREYEAMFAGVTRVSFFEIPAALKHLLWDVEARRLVSVAEVMGREDAAT